MLKKAGIVVALATAGLLSVSPLAFAGDGKDDKGHHRSEHGHGHKHDKGDKHDKRSGKKHIEIENDSAECDFNNTNETDVEQNGDATAFALLLGAVSNVVQVGQLANVPVNANVPIASCNNVHFEDNSQDNDRTIERSFND